MQNMTRERERVPEGGAVMKELKVRSSERNSLMVGRRRRAGGLLACWATARAGQHSACNGHGYWVRVLVPVLAGAGAGAGVGRKPSGGAPRVCLSVCLSPAVCVGGGRWVAIGGAVYRATTGVTRRYCETGQPRKGDQRYYRLGLAALRVLHAASSTQYHSAQSKYGGITAYSPKYPYSAMYSYGGTPRAALEARAQDPPDTLWPVAGRAKHCYRTMLLGQTLTKRP